VPVRYKVCSVLLIFLLFLKHVPDSRDKNDLTHLLQVAQTRPLSSQLLLPARIPGRELRNKGGAQGPSWWRLSGSGVATAIVIFWLPRGRTIVQSRCSFASSTAAPIECRFTTRLFYSIPVMIYWLALQARVEGDTLTTYTFRFYMHTLYTWGTSSKLLPPSVHGRWLLVSFSRRSGCDTRHSCDFLRPSRPSLNLARDRNNFRMGVVRKVQIWKISYELITPELITLRLQWTQLI